MSTKQTSAKKKLRKTTSPKSAPIGRASKRTTITTKKTAAPKTRTARSSGSKRAVASTASPVRKRHIAAPVGLAMVGLFLLSLGVQLGNVVRAASINPATTIQATAFEPKTSTQTLASGLVRPWDAAELPSGEILFTQRGGRLSSILNGNTRLVTSVNGVRAEGEGGLMGMAVDKSYSQNNYIYLCYNTVKDGRNQVIVSRFTYRNGQLTMSREIITGIPANTSGRHSGCQVETDNAGHVWVATGDAANSTTPQDPKSLGGKILRVNRDGAGVAGNMGGTFDPRIFNYGHRNSQGLYIFDSPINGNYGFSSEHGPARDDEMNQVRSGNFGWAPGAGYNEGVPMTDTNRFPNAVRATWQSGSSTIAVSGLTRLHGTQWGNWNGAYAMGVLKGTQIKLIQLNLDGSIKWQKTIYQGDFGRVRGAISLKDGSLVVTTDNGANDRVIKITAPKPASPTPTPTTTPKPTPTPTPTPTPAPTPNPTPAPTQDQIENVNDSCPDGSSKDDKGECANPNMPNVLPATGPLTYIGTSLLVIAAIAGGFLFSRHQAQNKKINGSNKMKANK